MKKGFTLIEVTVVVAVIIVLSSIFMANYREGEKQFSLQRSAHALSQDIRRAQEMAMAGESFEETFPKGGYGILFQEDADSYILFADCDGDNEYDSSGPALSCRDAGETGLGYAEKIEEVSLEKNVFIADVAPSDLEENLSIVFFPPDPKVTINGEPSVGSASIDLSFGALPLTVTVNKAGVIDVQ